jgi:hypothetical protein
MLVYHRLKLTSLRFRTLAPLAEAVEKYQVVSAMMACELCMRCVHIRINRNETTRLTVLRAAIPLHSLEVLEYATKHGYVETMNAAALGSIDHRPGFAKKRLSAEVFGIWVCFL